MANYSAVIDLRVNGVESLKIAKDTLSSIDRITKFIKPVPSLFDARGTEEVKKAKTELADLIKKYADGNTASAKFATTLAGLNSQLQTFKNVAANSKVGSDQFVNSLKAGEIASQRLFKAELERLTTLKGMYTRQATGTLSAADQGPTKLVRDLLAVRKEVPNSIAGLKSYASELQYVFELIGSGTPEFNLLQKAIASVNKEIDIAMGKGPMQGPKLPTGFTEAGPIKGRGPALPLSAKPKTGIQTPGVLDAILGGGFPMLFGGGPGAIAGGAIGGFLGGTMGGMAGMALSIGLSAVGQKLDEIRAKFTEIQAAAQTLNMDALRDSVLYVNQQLQVQVDTLIKAGEIDKARATIAAAIAKQTGVGAGTQGDIANAGAMLKKGFDDAAGALGGFLSILSGPLQVALALVVEGVAQFFNWFNQGLSALGDFIRNIPGLKGLGEAFKMPNEELEKANAQVQILNDKLMDEILINQKNLNLEKQRTLGRTAEERAINASLDRQKELNKINEDYNQKVKDFYDQNKNASMETLVSGVNLLEIRKQQAIEEVNIAYNLQEQAKQLDAINEKYTIQNQLLSNAQAQLDIQTLSAQLSGQITEQQAQELLSANQLLAVQQQLVLARQQLAQSAPLLTEQQINEAKAKILDLQKQEIQIKLKLQQEQIQRIRDEFTRSVAEGLRAPVKLVIDGQQLAASLKNAEQIIQSTLSVVNARYAAEKAINDLLIQRAEQEGNTQLAYELRVKQVELTYLQTIAQIRAEVEQARIKLLQVQLEYQKLDIQMRQIMLVRQLSQEERLMWQAQYDMLQLVKEQFDLTVKAAEYRIKEADAIRQMTLEQLAYNRAKEQGANIGNGSGGGGETTITITPPSAPRMAFAEGGFIDKPTVALMGEGGQGEFVIPENKMQTAMQRYISGKRGADAIPQDATDSAVPPGATSTVMPTSGTIRGASINPQINVTTGPVLELNNKRYVSQDDMVQSLRVSTDKAVEATLKLLQSNTRVRKSIGIA